MSLSYESTVCFFKKICTFNCPKLHYEVYATTLGKDDEKIYRLRLIK